MKPPLFHILSTFGLLQISLSLLAADVVINEIGAASSERILRTLPDGRSQLGWGHAWNTFEFDDADWEIGTSTLWIQ